MKFVKQLSLNDNSFHISSRRLNITLHLKTKYVAELHMGKKFYEICDYNLICITPRSTYLRGDLSLNTSPNYIFVTIIIDVHATALVCFVKYWPRRCDNFGWYLNIVNDGNGHMFVHIPFKKGHIILLRFGQLFVITCLISKNKAAIRVL